MRVGIIGHLLSFEPTYRQAGVSRYTEALVRELPAVAPNDDFVVFTGRQQPPEGRGFDPRVRFVHSPLPTEKPTVRIAWEQTAGVSVAVRERLDVVHAPVNVTPLVTGVPRVVTIHDLAFHLYPEQYPGAKQRYLRLMTRLSVQRAARVIAISESTRQDILRLYDCAPERVVVVPNGVSDAYQPLPADAVAAFRQAQGLPEHFILFLGTLQPRKNLDALLRAYARVADTVGWPLVVVGADGWDFQPVYRTAQELGIAEQVRFAGFAPQETLPLWYNAASMLVYPSLYEGFGLPLLESMACGTPVIAANTSSLPEVVGQAGLLIAPRDIEGLARAIQTLARDGGLRQELAERGLRRAAGYSWRATAQQTLEVYRDVAAGGGWRRSLRTRRSGTGTAGAARERGRKGRT